MVGSTRHFSFILFFFFLIESAESVDFSCPTKNITNENGVFPPNQNTIVTFPKGYNCTIGFEIQDGFVVKLTLASNVTQITQDSMIVVDALSKLRVYSQGVNLFIAPAKTAFVVLTGQSGTAQFWFRYEYVYVGQLEQVKYTTGTPFSLYFVPVKTYTVTSLKNDLIVMNSDSVETRDDVFLLNIYVYDGPDVNSPYVGTLYEYTDPNRIKKSSGSSLTFLNMYGSYSSSYGLANDYSAVSKFNFYIFSAFSQNHPIASTFSNSNGDSFGVTFYCIDCSTSYLSLLETSDIDEKQFQLSPLTPSNSGSTYLTYSSKDTLSQFMPQQIPGNLFTMSTSALKFTLRLASESAGEIAKWNTPYSGRKGYFFSPSLWSLGANSSFSYKFDSNTPMTFTFNVNSAHFDATNEQLNIQIGSPGVTPFSTTFSRDVKNPGVRVANGTFMQTTFTGLSSKSYATVTFSMEDASGPTTTTVITTAPSVETTTKYSWKTNSYLLITLFFILLSW